MMISIFLCFINYKYHKISVLVKLGDVKDPTSGKTGMAAVLDNCVHVVEGGFKKDGTKAKAIINVFCEYKGDHVALPLSVARRIVPTLKLERVKPTIPAGIKRHPKPSQTEILRLLFEHLALSHSAMLENDPGMGKTYMSLLAALSHGLPTICVCNRVDNCKQWGFDLLNIDPTIADKICILGSVAKGKKSAELAQFTATPENATFLMVRAGLLDGLELTVLWRYRFVILDETHLLATESQIRGILRIFRAQYVIGCSGTPDEKADGRHEMIQFILGDESIVARSDRVIDFVFFNMNIHTSEKEYEKLLRGGGKAIRYNAEGQKEEVESCAALAEYGRMELSIAYDPLTNNRICVIALCLVRLHKHKLLIICKTTAQCKSISITLQSWGITSSVYTGQEKTYDGYAEVLIGTSQLTLTAFDQGTTGIPFDRRFTAAILCQSLKDVGNLRQGIGRIMRAPDNEKPVFVWLQYPMKAYDKHTSIMKAAVTELGHREQDHAFIIPKNVYGTCFGNNVEIEIIRTESIEDGIKPHVPIPLECIPSPS